MHTLNNEVKIGQIFFKELEHSLFKKPEIRLRAEATNFKNSYT